jgi:starvation-inducible DNA-binding protein
MNEMRTILPTNSRREAIKALNQTVVELLDLFACVKQAHWNMRGTGFARLDEMAGHIMGHIYRTVERATMLGALSNDSFGETVKQSQLSSEKEVPESLHGPADWIQELASLHALACRHIRQGMKQLAEVQDLGSADLLADILRTLDTHLWLLESQLSHQQKN